MKIGIAKEIIEGENRVALIPESVKRLTGLGFEIALEAGAGEKSRHSDADYKEAGATIVDSFEKLASQSEIIVKVRHPVKNSSGKNEAELIKENGFLFAMQDPIGQPDNLKIFQDRKIHSFSMEFIPRSTLAQSMDVLSSMATIAGYKAVLIAASELEAMFPMMMTAAGTLTPAKVLVLGAGVAGLQAIATAKRLGAVVEAFDVRPDAKEQVLSLGAKFLEMELDESMQDEQGYAKMASEEFIKKEMELIDKHLSKSDICITTAQVFGRKAPILVKEYMLKNMKPGSVIIDLASETGGNVEPSKPGETVEQDGVRVIGPKNIASTMPVHASLMYSKNLENLLKYLYKDGSLNLDKEDEIVSRTTLTRDGEMVSEIVKKFTQG